jgi:hypothetical protein
MHSSLPIPHPLARLFRIIAAFERARAAHNPPAGRDSHLLDRLTDPRDNAPADYRTDLEFLSLSRCGQPPARRSDDLDFTSLSAVEGMGSDGRDSLVDLSLERSFPPSPRSLKSSSDAEGARPPRAPSRGRRYI